MVSINENAPIVASLKIEIKAEPETVRNILADFEAWPKWESRCKRNNSPGRIKTRYTI